MEKPLWWVCETDKQVPEMKKLVKRTETVQGWRAGKLRQTLTRESGDNKQKSGPEELLNSGGNSKCKDSRNWFYYKSKLLGINKIIQGTKSFNTKTGNDIQYKSVLSLSEEWS